MKRLLLLRPLAYFIDFIIMWCACVLPQLIAYWLFNEVPFKYFNKPFHVYFWVLFTVSVPLWLYFILKEKSANQATIGKKIMKLKVADKNSNRITGKQSFIRTLVKLLPWEITHIGLLPIYFSKDPQPGIGLYIANALILIYIIYFIARKGSFAIHDVVSKTKVVSVA
jgi:uncharacterized RDD family membrane protein YckC